MNILAFMMITAGIPGLLTLYYIHRVHDTLIFRTMEQIIVVRLLSLMYLLPLLCYILYIQVHYDVDLFQQYLAIAGILSLLFIAGFCLLYHYLNKKIIKNKEKYFRKKAISSVLFNISEACLMFTLMYATFTLIFCGILDILGYSQLLEFQNVYYLIVEHLMLLTLILTMFHISKYLNKKQQETIEEVHLRKTLTKLKVKK